MKIIEHDFELDAVLQKPLFAHLSTLGKQGPAESPVWFLWEDECLWFIASNGSGFVKHLSQDPRCAVGIVDFDLSAGTLRHVGMRGQCELLTVEWTRLCRLLLRYVGPEPSWNPRFRSNVIERQDILIRFTPETIVARDQSYFR